jgi:hypothetical protein
MKRFMAEPLPGKGKGNGKEARIQKVKGAPEARSAFTIRASLPLPFPLPWSHAAPAN